MTKLEERLNEAALAYICSEKVDVEDSFTDHKDSFKAGAKFILDLPELRGLVECAEFYSKIENLGKTVWEDYHRRDGKCWLENFDRYEIAECYGPTSTGDYGIKADDALEKWRSFIGDSSGEGL